MCAVGAKATLTLVESFVAATDAAYQINDSIFVSVGAGARLDHVRLMEDRSDAFNLSTFQVELGKEATLNTFNLTSGAAVSRYNLSLKFAGEGARAETFGVNLLRGNQHGDSTLVVDHAVPGCMSRETFRSVLDDQARSVFQGRIIVRPGAQKTDGKMMTRALLLSEEAEADHKPELEIFADDVTCGHGAVSGALDEDLLFYLRARGLPEQEAQALLIQAFVGEAIEAVVDEKLREAAHCRRRPLAQGARAMTMHQPIHPAVANGKLDVAKLRQDFPALALQVYGKPLVYLDNAASAQKPLAVLNRMDKAYRTEYANVHRGLHYLANAATEAYEGARTKAAGFVNASRSEEIIFTRNATEAINLVASSFAAPIDQGRRRDRALDHGAPFQHRALAFPARAAGRGPEMGPMSMTTAIS